MNRKQFEKWGKSREGGRKRFVLRNGMCFFGLSWAFFMSLMFGLGLLGGKSGDRLAQAAAGWRWEAFGQGVLVYLPSGLVAGALWGLIMWHTFEWQYRRQLRKDAATGAAVTEEINT